jgi:hypothetical protein
MKERRSKPSQLAYDAGSAQKVIVTPRAHLYLLSLTGYRRREQNKRTATKTFATCVCRLSSESHCKTSRSLISFIAHGIQKAGANGQRNVLENLPSFVSFHYQYIALVVGLVLDDCRMRNSFIPRREISGHFLQLLLIIILFFILYHGHFLQDSLVPFHQRK